MNSAATTTPPTATVSPSAAAAATAAATATATATATSNSASAVQPSWLTSPERFKRLITATPHTLLVFHASSPSSNSDAKDATPQANSSTAQEDSASASTTPTALHQQAEKLVEGRVVGIVHVDARLEPHWAEQYGIRVKDAPVFKLLHKGIHFATVSGTETDDLNDKVRELVAL